MNQLLSMLTGGNNQNGSFMQIMMQALNAAMNGESAEDFMKKLAKNNPRLQGLDLNNLENTAHTLAQQNGVNEEALAQDLKNRFGNTM